MLVNNICVQCVCYVCWLAGLAWHWEWQSEKEWKKEEEIESNREGERASTQYPMYGIYVCVSWAAVFIDAVDCRSAMRATLAHILQMQQIRSECFSNGGYIRRHQLETCTLIYIFIYLVFEAHSSFVSLILPEIFLYLFMILMLFFSSSLHWMSLGYALFFTRQSFFVWFDMCHVAFLFVK